jgi:hypothetical protein
VEGKGFCIVMMELVLDFGQNAMRPFMRAMLHLGSDVQPKPLWLCWPQEFFSWTSQEGTPSRGSSGAPGRADRRRHLSCNSILPTEFVAWCTESEGDYHCIPPLDLKVVRDTTKDAHYSVMLLDRPSASTTHVHCPTRVQHSQQLHHCPIAETIALGPIWHAE